MSDDMRNATQGALALYLNEVQPVDGRVQINVSIDELTVLRHLASATPAVGGEDDYAFRFQYADGSAFQIYADGRAYIMAKDGSIRDKPKGVVTNRIPLLIGMVAKPRQDRIEELEAQVAAPPASPLRGREDIETLLALLNPLHGSLDLQVTAQFTDEAELDPPKDREYNVDVTWQMERDLTQAVLILENRLRASPPEQPAAYPSAEADEAHADLLRRLAAVPKEEKE